MIEPSPTNLKILLPAKTTHLPNILLSALFGTTSSRNILLLCFQNPHYRLPNFHHATPNPNPNHQLLRRNPNQTSHPPPQHPTSHPANPNPQSTPPPSRPPSSPGRPSAAHPSNSPSPPTKPPSSLAATRGRHVTRQVRRRQVRRQLHLRLLQTWRSRSRSGMFRLLWEGFRGVVRGFLGRVVRCRFL